MGMPPVGDARERFNIWFYIIGMEFIIFDVEIAFLYLGRSPSGNERHSLPGHGDLPRRIALSLVYAWKRGALQWE